MLLLAGMLAASISGPFERGASAMVPKSDSTITNVAFDVQDFTLDNGLRVYVVEDHSTPAFNITLAYDVGSRDEVAGRTGFAHFFEHMMFQGSKNLGPMVIGDYTNAAGGSYNASTGYDVTLYYHNLPSNYLDMVLWGESDRLRSLDINDNTFDTQRKAVISEKNMRIDNVPYMTGMQYGFLADVFAGTPYAHPVIGSLEDLNAAKTADVQEFFKLYYAPNNCVMVIVGDVTLAQVQEKVKHYFGDIPKGNAKPPVADVQQNRSNKVEKKIGDKLAPQPLLLFGWPTVPESHPDRPALELLGQIMASGESSRLVRSLKDEKKLAVEIGGGHQAMNKAGYLGLQVLPAPGVSADAVKAALAAELAKIIKRGVNATELKVALARQTMFAVSALATNSGRAGAIATGALFYNDPRYVTSDLARLQSVKAADILRVAKTYLGGSWIYYEIGPG
jgi:zinc protease